MTAVPAPAPNADKLALELGLTNDEYERIVATLGREPSAAELGTYSVMWSEHCSYKSSRVHLRRLPTEGPAILVGPGENAGVVDVGGGQAVTFKIESHNHPSFVEPFQGAATGVGGIIRDILTMGARPIALMDPLRFGGIGPDDANAARTRHIVDGVVRGISHYGNSIGVATVGGETVFDPSYAGNPLVNVLCVGVLPADRIQLAKAEEAGDIAVLIGQRTGRDGIGGASVLASVEFSDEGVDDSKRPNVQVGDPFAGKLLIECCLQLYAAQLLSGIQDMGAAGIACSTSEMAAKADMGMLVDLDKVPLREASMDAWEILCSESQERMLALVRPDRLDRVLEICARWGVQATPIGEVIEGDRLVFTRHGEVVHDAPAKSLVDEGPVYDRPIGEWVHPHRHEDVDTPAPADADALRREVLAVLSAPNIASSRWVWQQYDSIVGSGTFQGPGADAAVIRLPAAEGQDSRRGIAVATDGNGRWCALDPAEGARLVVAEAARNVACTGARPIAATNCLNFGSPERPDVMAAFSDVIDGMSEACQALGTPITGGNVSFYNQTGDAPIHPTPVIGVLGALDDVTEAVATGVRAAGDVLFLVGAPTRPGLGGSEWLWATQQRIAGPAPRIDLDEERRLHELLVERSTLLRSAHDVAAGGMVVSLAETLLAGAVAGLGATVELEDVDVRQALFSESPTRVVVSVAAADEQALRDACAAQDLACHRLGPVTRDATLSLAGVELPLEQLRTLTETALPAALEDEVAGAT